MVMAVVLRADGVWNAFVVTDAVSRCPWRMLLASMNHHSGQRILDTTEQMFIEWRGSAPMRNPVRIPILPSGCGSNC